MERGMVEVWVVGTVPRSVCDDVSMHGYLASGAPILLERQTQQQHTRVVNAVLPPPLGPTSKNVGSPVVLAAFL